jgi:large subunit ribosomal protein L37Ae
MHKTKKVKSAGRFGSRYGRGIRDRVVNVEEKQRRFHECPSCGFNKVKRVSTGLFRCRKCDAVFTGGAYYPSTMGGTIVKKMVSQRKFIPLVKELIESREETAMGMLEKKQRKKGKKEGAEAEKPKKKKKSTPQEKEADAVETASEEVAEEAEKEEANLEEAFEEKEEDGA